MLERLVVSNEKASPVLVIGSIAYDNIETPYEMGERVLGGAASFGSLAASYFAPTRLVGVVGNDFDRVYLEKFKRRGIDIEGVKIDETGRTFFWRGRYCKSFDIRETLEIQLNVFKDFDPIVPESYEGTCYVLLGNIDPDVQMRMLDRVGNDPFVVADTIDLWIETKRERLMTLLAYVDLFVINEHEARSLTGERLTVTAGKKILKYGPKIVILKKGEHGAVLFHQDGIFSIPAYPLEGIKDPTGAGDTFAGALLGYLAAVNKTDFNSIKHAMIYGAAVASLTVEAFSCDGLETSGVVEIQKRYEYIRSMIAM